MNAVESVGAEFYGECILPFLLLETLEFVDMQHWKQWLPFQHDRGGDVFPCLKQLSINECYKLEGVVHTTAKVEFELLESLCLSNISELMSLQTGELCRRVLTKVKDLKINGCEELTSSLKNEARLLQQLTFLGRLEIEDNSPLVEELGKEVEELLQLNLSSLQEVHIHECPRSFPDVGLPPSLKDIVIIECHSLIYFAKHQIPQNLRRIEIRNCKRLKSLVDEEAVGSWSSFAHSYLEYLNIQECQSLTSLSLRGQLLRTFEHLEMCYCEQQELIASDGFFGNNTNHCLECIKIWECQNLKSLPDGLCHLNNLQTLNIDLCGSPVSIPRLSGGRRASNLRNILITNCDKLEALPLGMHNLNSLKELDIDYFEGLTCSVPPT
ncbi:putative disease resistance protein At3g14460 [Pyrus x bretschneideri]|uniref:putative disease resistance protein At3g14460 n=1 Tax=Pyrus x bretschneideri TaxID=225117 RepID=UPI0020306682|nr:putative disease resistance protein At3g14460 [Pyrus x bretschneideri]